MRLWSAAGCFLSKPAAAADLQRNLFCQRSEVQGWATQLGGAAHACGPQTCVSGHVSGPAPCSLPGSAACDPAMYLWTAAGVLSWQACSSCGPAPKELSLQCPEVQGMITNLSRAAHAYGPQTYLSKPCSRLLAHHAACSAACMDQRPVAKTHTSGQRPKSVLGRSAAAADVQRAVFCSCSEVQGWATQLGRAARTCLSRQSSRLHADHAA